MSVIDSMSVSILTNAATAARDTLKYSDALNRVSTVSRVAGGPLRIVGEALESLGPGGVAIKAGVGLKLVGASMELIGSNRIAGRANSGLGSMFGWLLRIGSFFVPGGSLLKFLAAGGAIFGLVKTGQAIRNVSRDIDAMIRRYDIAAKSSRKLGVATANLVGLEHAASMTANMLSGTFGTALQRQTRRVAEAAKGTGEARLAIAELGLDARRLAILSPDRQFLKIADAMSNVANQGDRVRLAMKIFDTEGVALVNTLALGAAGVQNLIDEAKAMGIAPTEAQAAAAERYAELVAKTGLRWQGVWDRVNRIALPLKQIGTLTSSLGASLTNSVLATMGRVFSWADKVVQKIKGGGAELLRWIVPLDAIARKLGIGGENAEMLARFERGEFGKGSPAVRTAGATPVARDPTNHLELVARTSGSVDTFSAARRNLRGAQNPLVNLVSVAKEQLKQLERLNEGDSRPPVYAMAGAS